MLYKGHTWWWGWAIGGQDICGLEHDADQNVSVKIRVWVGHNACMYMWYISQVRHSMSHVIPIPFAMCVVSYITALDQFLMMANSPTEAYNETGLSLTNGKF